MTSGDIEVFGTSSKRVKIYVDGFCKVGSHWLKYYCKRSCSGALNLERDETSGPCCLLGDQVRFQARSSSSVRHQYGTATLAAEGDIIDGERWSDGSLIVGRQLPYNPTYVPSRATPQKLKEHEVKVEMNLKLLLEIKCHK